TFRTANGGAPSISSLSPTQGGPDQLSYITINGNNFGSSADNGSVTVGGVTATPLYWTARQVLVPVPNGLAAGNVNVVVTAYGLTSNAQSFLVTPYLTGISPSPAPINTPATISGAGFRSSASNGTVTFNGTLAFPTSWADNSIVVPVPIGATSGD